MNALNIDLTDKMVIVVPGFAVKDRRFQVKGGFGAKPYTPERTLFGIWVEDSQAGNISGLDVERLATAEEVEGGPVA